MNRALEAQALNDAYRTYIIEESMIFLRSPPSETEALLNFERGVVAARAKYEAMAAVLGKPE